MVSSISRRLPQKICGLFDIGSAGGTAVTTSSGQSASADVLSVFDLGDTWAGADSIHESYLDLGIDPDIGSGEEKLTCPLDQQEADWDFFDGLGDFSDDPLGDSSLDAFVNLDSLLQGTSFLDDTGDLPPLPEESEVKPEESEVQPVIDMTVAQRNVSTLQIFDTVASDNGVKNSGPVERKVKKSLKRKLNSNKKIKTSVIKTQVPELSVSESSVETHFDHDYTAKCQKVSVSDDSAVAEVSLTLTEASTSKETAKPEEKHRSTIRRIKNNIASKRSREQRKQKFVEMDEEAEALIVENERLRAKIVELEQLAKEMKETLIAKMAGK